MPPQPTTSPPDLADLDAPAEHAPTDAYLEPEPRECATDPAELGAEVRQARLFVDSLIRARISANGPSLPRDASEAPESINEESL